jgi:electron transfer flavoprotein alpha subunit
MSNILVFLQHVDGKLTKGSLIAISVASQLQAAWKKSGISAIVVGEAAEKAADESLAYGISEAFFSEDTGYNKYLAATYFGAVQKVWSMSGCDTLVGTATSLVKDLFPRVAVSIDAGQASDVIAINSDGTLKRPMYAGDVIADVEVLTPNKVVSVRATAFQPAAQATVIGKKTKFDSTLDANGCEVISYELSKGGRPELGDAEVVVSGGRALQSAENFEKYIFPLADAFGAAVGASRAAVDSGYAPNDWQVGQTGKVVAPSLYVAVGISGAIQHLAGMKDSKKIVAINKDPDAPIFEVADYGLVADLFEVVPKLTEMVQKAKSGN